MLKAISRGGAITAVTTALFGCSLIQERCPKQELSSGKAAMFRAEGTGEPVGPNGETFTPATPELRPLRKSGPFLSVPETIQGGTDLLDMLRRDDTAARNFRWRYYTISKTWHSKQHNGLGGGEYGEQWFALLEHNLKFPRPLGLDDFGNLHAYAFFTMWRSMRAIAATDIDPDAAAEPNPPDKPHIFSFHWPPNDGSYVVYDLKVLGIDPNKT